MTGAAAVGPTTAAGADPAGDRASLQLDDAQQALVQRVRARVDRLVLVAWPASDAQLPLHPLGGDPAVPAAGAPAWPIGHGLTARAFVR